MPPACAACGRSGALLCPRCMDGLQRPSLPADRFLAPDAAVVIGESLSLALAAFAYDGPMRRALAALKYAGASRMAPILARAAEPALRELLALTGPATLVPVPVHVERRRARGYNQAELLARHLGRLRGAPGLGSAASRSADHEAASAQPGRPAPEPARGVRACGRVPGRRRPRSWSTTSSPPRRRWRRARRCCALADARRCTDLRWRERSRPSRSRSAGARRRPPCRSRRPRRPAARGSRARRAPTRPSSTAAGSAATFVTRPCLLTKTASMAYGMKNMWIDGDRSIQSPSPGSTTGVRRRPTVRSTRGARHAHPLGDGGAAGHVLDPDEALAVAHRRMIAGPDTGKAPRSAPRTETLPRRR